MTTNIVGIERAHATAKFLRSELRQARTKIRTTADEGEKRAERLYVEVLTDMLSDLKQDRAALELD